MPVRPVYLLLALIVGVSTGVTLGMLFRRRTPEMEVYAPPTPSRDTTVNAPVVDRY